MALLEKLLRQRFLVEILPSRQTMKYTIYKNVTLMGPVVCLQTTIRSQQQRQNQHSRNWWHVTTVISPGRPANSDVWEGRTYIACLPMAGRPILVLQHITYLLPLSCSGRRRSSRRLPHVSFHGS